MRLKRSDAEGPGDRIPFAARAQDGLHELAQAALAAAGFE